MTDPRTDAQSIDSARRPIAKPQYLEFDAIEPSSTSPLGSRTWSTRAQNLSIVVSNLVAGDVVEHRGTYEHVVIVAHATGSVQIRSGDESVRLDGTGLAVVPPGSSSLIAVTDTTVVRLLDCRETSLLAEALNAAAYETPDPRAPAFEPWPDPVDGHRLRMYRQPDFPTHPGRFGTIFRTSSFMVNFLDPSFGPRDPDQLSPHHHEDFEQVSLATEGTWLHHIRTPWGPRRSAWRDDEHRSIGSPSITIIPPPTVHTSEATGAERNALLDIFSPPRADFSARPGWVLNAVDYPEPTPKRRERS